jgi:hypothetical protein
MTFPLGFRVFLGFGSPSWLSISPFLSFFLLVCIMICFACTLVCVGVSAEQFYWVQSINQSINQSIEHQVEAKCFNGS